MSVDIYDTLSCKPCSLGLGGIGIDNNVVSLRVQRVKHLPAMWGVRSLDREELLEKEMATHSGTLAWKIPWMEKPARL